MNEKEPASCKYCGWKIPPDFFQFQYESHQSLCCEYCGSELPIDEYISIHSSEGSDTQPEPPPKPNKKQKFKSFLRNLYEKLPYEKNPIIKVARDSDFSENFKQNFIIVIARLLYPHISEIKESSVIDKPELTKGIIDKLFEKISPIFHMRIQTVYLTNLHKISIKEFEGWLKKLQTKLRLSKNFNWDFVIYIRFIIREVFEIIAEIEDANSFPKFKKVVLNDLKAFHHIHYSQSKQNLTQDKMDESVRKGSSVINESVMRKRLPTNLQGAKIIATIIDREYSSRRDIPDFTNKLEPAPASLEFANKWFTNSLKAVMLKYKFLSRYASFRKMSSFYGLTKSYLYDIRYKKVAIAHEYLDQMKKSLSEKLSESNKSTFLKAIEAKYSIFSIIETYRKVYDPKPTAKTQINRNLKQDYFSLITTNKQAYFLGLMFADGWISVQHSKTRVAYRIGFALKIEDRAIVEDFTTSIGFTRDKVDIKDFIDSKTRKRYKMAYLYFGAGSSSLKYSMANDLIKLGMTYRVNEKTGRRYKNPILPIFCDSKGIIQKNLMLSFLLGYYDGDGTLKDNKYPIIYSSYSQFLEAISRVFNLGSLSETKREVIDVDTNEIRERILYSLSLSQSLFKEMMSLNLDSMSRKAIRSEDIILDSPVMTKIRLWLMEMLPKDFLIRVLETHSPSKVAELIGIDHITLIKFIDCVHKIPRKDKSYYIKLAYRRNRQSKGSEYNVLYDEITHLLTDIRDKNPFR
ncbi:MAG: hypothetical protein ACFFBI_08800 [Promethearchaeota archaeon]